MPHRLVRSDRVTSRLAGPRAVIGRLAASLVLVALATCGARADSGAAEPGQRAAESRPSSLTGAYVGGHFGYAWGGADWTASAPSPAGGALDFFEPYDAFKGTGSFFTGVQAGYRYVLPSGILLGVEADVSAPNTIRGAQAFASPAIGQASYQEKV